MPAHADILDRADSLNRPLSGSVVLHGAVLASIDFLGRGSFAAITRHGATRIPAGPAA